jgi:hypothetical protein
MSRTNQVLAAILALQIVVGVVVFWPRGVSDAAGEPLYPDVEAEQVTRVSIVDDAGEAIEMARMDAGWVLAAAGDYPCREDAVPQFLDKLLALAGDRVVTETRASHKRLGVAENAYTRRIAFETADGTEHVFYLGSSPSYNVSHVRLADADEVYLVSGLSSTDAAVRASSWIDTTYLTLTQDQVQALTVENANGAFAFTKDADGTWTMAGLAADETLDEGWVSSLVTRISSVRMLAPLGTEEDPAYGLADPSAVVTAVTRDGEGGSQTAVLALGARRESDGAYVVKSSASPYYVRVAEYTVQDLVTTSHENVIEVPETPVPAPAGP